MPFVDLHPARGKCGTGITISRSDRNGVIVSISGAAREALRLTAGDHVRIQHDADPALPRLRIMRDDGGQFVANLSPGGKKRGDSADATLLVRVGRTPALAGDPASGLDCTWEAASIPAAIEIDLPREMRSTTSVQVSAGNGRTASVTLPGRTPVDRVKPPA